MREWRPKVAMDKPAKESPAETNPERQHLHLQVSVSITTRHILTLFKPPLLGYCIIAAQTN